jgi:hypothetical protein
MTEATVRVKDMVLGELSPSTHTAGARGYLARNRFRYDGGSIPGLKAGAKLRVYIESN